MCRPTAKLTFAKPGVYMEVLKDPERASGTSESKIYIFLAYYLLIPIHIFKKIISTGSP